MVSETQGACNRYCGRRFIHGCVSSCGQNGPPCETLRNISTCSYAFSTLIPLYITGDLGGAIGSLLVRIMLSHLGQRKTLAIYSCIDAAALIIALLIVKERRRPGSRRAPIVWFDKSFLSDPVFWSLGACFLVTVLYVSVFQLSYSHLHSHSCTQRLLNPNLLLAHIHERESPWYQ